MLNYFINSNLRTLYYQSPLIINNLDFIIQSVGRWAVGVDFINKREKP